MIAAQNNSKVSDASPRIETSTQNSEDTHQMQPIFNMMQQEVLAEIAGTPCEVHIGNGVGTGIGMGCGVVVDFKEKGRRVRRGLLMEGSTEID